MIQKRAEKFGDTDIWAWDYDGTHEGMLAIREVMSKEDRLGGSDIGVLLGVSNFRSPAELIFSKLGLLTSSSSGEAAEGHIYEDAIITRWECHDENDAEFVKKFNDPEKRTRKVERLSYTITNDEIPYGFFNIDGKVVLWDEYPTPAIMDAKFLRGDAWRRYEGGHIPQYILQGQFYMMGCGAKTFALAVQTQGYGFQERIYQNEESLVDEITKTALSFVRELKGLRKVMREGNDVQFANAILDVSSMFGSTKDVMDCLSYVARDEFTRPVEATKEMDDNLNRLMIVNQSIKDLSEEKKFITSTFKEYLLRQGARSLVFPGGGQMKWGSSATFSKLGDRVVNEITGVKKEE